MKIQILQDDTFIELSDEALDNDNFVNLRIENGEGSMEQDVLLSELMPALIAFDAKRSRRLTDENPTL